MDDLIDSDDRSGMFDSDDLRCPKCSRIFCCPKHRADHQWQIHQSLPKPVPVIKRRFRSTEPGSSATAAKNVVVGTFNARKRKHEVTLGAVQPPTVSVSSGVREQQERERQLQEERRCEQQHRERQMQEEQQHRERQMQEEQQHRERQMQEEQQRERQRHEQQQHKSDQKQPEQQQSSEEVPERFILKARRSKLSLLVDLRPVAESSPTVPPQYAPYTPATTQSPYTPITTAAVQFPCTPCTTTTAQMAYATATVQSPYTPITTAAVQFPYTPATTATVQSPYTVATAAKSFQVAHSEFATPVGSDVGSPPSFYQTPMQSVAGSVLSPVLFTSSGAPENPLVGDKSSVRKTAKKDSSINRNSTHKGFFWSNMARRFRLALRPAKPKVRESSASPNGMDMDTLYGNIKSRRPINNDVSTSVYARPSIEDIRKAHEEANKAMNKISD